MYWQSVVREARGQICASAVLSSPVPFHQHCQQNLHMAVGKVTQSSCFLVLSTCQHLKPKCVPSGSINSDMAKFIYLYRFIFKLQSHIDLQSHNIQASRRMFSSPMTPTQHYSGNRNLS